MRLRAPHVLTQDAADRHLLDGVVDILDGRIAWVGPAVDAPTHPGLPTVHLDGALLPGFVDAHAHTPMVLLRGAGQDLPVDRWLREVIWPREARLTADDVRWGMTLGGAELLAGGVTTSVEMYFSPSATVAAAAEVGLRTVVLAAVLVDDALAHLGTWEHQLAAATRLAAAHRDDPLTEIGVGPHAAYTVPPEALRGIGEVARAEGLLVHTHVAEGRHEGDVITAEHGVSVPRYLDDLGVLDGRALLAHGVWLDDADVALLAARGTGVAHCPASNAKHASGLAPVRALRAAGVPVAIATDGPASHDRLDLFEEMRTAIRQARLREGDAQALGARDALRMVTREAADALGREDLGALEVGRRADLQHLRLDEVAPIVAPGDVPAQLVWSGGPHLVDRVWVGGREVVRDGRVTTVDVAEARAEVTTRARRLASA
ncbi:amidohydrolase [Nitriliruptoraceae bacterium ZYF776]|nr:amidohydrolase [Profundirhabdus halotolerans]